MTSFQFTIQENGLTIEDLLKERWHAGKKTVHLLRMAKSVTDIEGEPIDWRVPLNAGTQLTIAFPDARSTYLPKKQGQLSVIFEDDHILTVLKPAGIATHPDEEDEANTLINAVMAYIETNGGVYAEHIHRLDKGTAGLIMVAKHPISKSLFDRMLESNAIKRKYVAETDGLIKRPKGSIKLPIGKDRHQPSKRRVSMSGQSAVTHFYVLERTENSTFVEAELETGRTHQIRVHLSHIGHPVKGDTLYGGSATDDGQYRLTATSLSFIHPFTNEPTTIAIP